MSRYISLSTITTALTILPRIQAILSSPPLIINTWSGPFTAATDAAFFALTSSLSSSSLALDAAQAGCQACQSNQCDTTVGFGGSPDESCETTLDALIMDGQTLNAGAVANLRRVKDAVGVARHVLEHTRHTLLAGEQATQFAVENGFAEESLSTEDSLRVCHEWRANNCQPNYRSSVLPDPLSSCGPYIPNINTKTNVLADNNQHLTSQSTDINDPSHDTLSLIALSAAGQLATCTTTNGASHKIPGRVGDGPIPGSGSYADSQAGACAATGDGDLMMRLLPCYQAVESLRRGMTPLEAAQDAVRRIVARFPDARTGIVVVDLKGEHAGAGSGWEFTYSYRGGGMERAEVVVVEALDKEADERLEL
ncbi:asparaginase-like protein [Trichoderma reesei QM6a]|jgi:N4-(beta-N-acetylglucosaminyl)-L-asparaginase|uniref:Asparaginase-like protein n=2 Tax=Hypocrea jecorina TaxID=51453 RepID=G0RX67_HYPJQ|nr:asparaginase-like protein [Trichoderma reesei QM6a]EGR44239.1 asparaginase-like protein [Trichoderma reesei QM6a]ETR96859.1 aspartylglucosaminidase [Trichoderma reesei RUT C-30]